MKILIGIGLLLLILNHAEPATAAELNTATAETHYQEFIALYTAELVTNRLLNQALEHLQQAYQLEPEIFKFSFASGAVYDALADYSSAYDWYTRASALATSAEQKTDAEIAARESLFLSVALAARNQSRSNSGVEIRFVLKGREFEPELRQGDNMHTLYPADLAAPDRKAYLYQRFNNLMPFDNNLFFVVSYSSNKTAEQQHRDGINDFYNYYQRHIFGGIQHDQFLVFVGDSAEDLTRLTAQLYPDINFVSRDPFMGYFNPRDNLMIATVYGGYGTLLHEMMHGLIHADFPNAPGWLEEGLATLYERTLWRGSKLVALPNWRLDGVNISSFEDLEYFERYQGNISLNNFDLAGLRLLYMYIDSRDQLRQMYSKLKMSEGKLPLSEILATLSLDQKDWEAFLEVTLLEYQVDIDKDSGRLINPAEVTFVQRALNKLVGAGLKEDGHWGELTADKVRQYQELRGLEIDGVVGKNTRERLQREYAQSVIQQ